MQKPPRFSTLDITHEFAKHTLVIFPLNEGVGSAEDVVNDISLYFANGAWSPSIDGVVLDFNGSDTYAQMTTPFGLYFPHKRFSAATLFKIRTLPSNESRDFQVFRLRHSLTPTIPIEALIAQSDNKVGFTLVNHNHSSETVWSTNALAIDTWYFLVCTYDGAFLRIYINGLLACTPVAQTGAAHESTSTPFLGSGDSTSNLFDGYISCFYMWDTTIFSSNVTHLYADPWCMMREDDTPFDLLVAAKKKATGSMSTSADEFSG